MHPGTSDNQARRQYIAGARVHEIFLEKFTRLKVWTGHLSKSIECAANQGYLQKGGYLYQALYILSETLTVMSPSTGNLLTVV